MDILRLRSISNIFSHFVLKSIFIEFLVGNFKLVYKVNSGIEDDKRFPYLNPVITIRPFT